MCTPKQPKVDPVPVRSSTALPNNGDPAVRAADRGSRRRTYMTNLASQMLGKPSTTAPLGQTGNG